jgi:hypothetical protein
MPTFKEITAADIKTSRSALNQLVDVIQNDISGSSTRKKYQVFVTGGIGPGVTSSLFQTVFDQDYTLQTANEVLDLTVGLFSGSSTVAGSTTGVDSAGKLLFPSQSLMMREKINVYRQFAQTLLGDADAQFSAPFSNPATTDYIDEAIFVNIKRLFARDRVKPQTFAMQFYTSATLDRVADPVNGAFTNTDETSEIGSAILTDAGQGTQFGFGGQVGDIAFSTLSSNVVGNLFYDQGIMVLDAKKVLSGTQHVSGVIDALTSNAYRDATAGQTIIGDARSGNGNAKFIPDFFVSASIDDVVDHLASCRFSSGSLTALTFQNVTNINSTLVFCRATADEFNYSANPTFTDADGNIIVIDDPTTDRTFSYITTVGLYDANDNLLAVAKMSRPIEKNDEKDLTFRVRLDF